MHRSTRYVILGIVLCALAFVALALTGPETVLARLSPGIPEPAPPAGGPEQVGTVSGYFWSFAAKFVCGFQPPNADPAPGEGEPVVKPGNYATEINAHNPNYKQMPVRKKVIVLVDPFNGPVGREPNAQQPRVVTGTVLGPDFAMFDDCNALWRLVYPAAPPPAPMPLFVGYLVFLTPLDLDIDAVYTADAPGTLQQLPTGIAIDVNRVPGKRVYIPAGAVP